jgi:hypothetical protein
VAGKLVVVHSVSTEEFTEIVGKLDCISGIRFMLGNSQSEYWDMGRLFGPSGQSPLPGFGFL